MEPRSGIITLTTDFGTRDAYVGIMKGVICSVLPSVRIVDITHLIPPQRILDAALLVEAAYPWFPPGTVHIVVVDPGVGTQRRPVAVDAGGQLFVGPDNGVLSAPLAEPGVRVHEITEVVYELPDRSDTFHGRDVFAPAAAHLASGLEIDRLGPWVSDWQRLDLPKPRVTKGRIVGVILRTDRFGNALSNIPRSMLREIGAGPYAVQVGSKSYGELRRRYQDAALGEALALTGSDGRIEIAVSGGNAAETLRIRPGDRIVVQPVSAERGEP